MNNLKINMNKYKTNRNFQDLVPKMAIEYPFDLDYFQKEAVYHLENNERYFRFFVFVCFC